MSIKLRSSHYYVISMSYHYSLLCHSLQFVVKVEGRWLLLAGDVSTLTPQQALRRSEGTNRRKKGAEKKIYSKAADNLQFTNIVSMNLRVISWKCQMTKIRNPSGHKIAVLQRRSFWAELCSTSRIRADKQLAATVCSVPHLSVVTKDKLLVSEQSSAIDYQPWLGTDT